MSLFRSPPLVLSGRHRTHWTTRIPPKDYWCGVGRQIGLRQIRTAIVPQKTDLARKWLSHVVVVDKAGFPDPDRQHGEGARRREGLRIDELGVVHPGQRFSFNGVEDLEPEAVGVALPSLVCSGGPAQSCAEAHGRLPLCIAKVGIPRAQSKGVRLPNCRTD